MKRSNEKCSSQNKCLILANFSETESINYTLKRFATRNIRKGLPIWGYVKRNSCADTSVLRNHSLKHPRRAILINNLAQKIESGLGIISKFNF